MDIMKKSKKDPEDVPIRQIIPGQLAKSELKQVPIATLIPYEKNPRKNADAVDKVAASLKEFGLVKNSVLCDENMVLITGHTTIKAMQKLGWDKVPEVTQVSGLTENQKKAYRIADNKLGEIAEWDLGLLTAQLNELKVDGMDISITGFDEKEFDTLMKGLVSDKGFGEDFILPTGDKTFTTISFTLTEEQADFIKLKINLAKKQLGEPEGDNKNGNGNALFLVVTEWSAQRT